MTILAAIAALTSCQKDLSGQKSDDGQMRFVMSLDTPTKATASNFEIGDKVGLFVVEYAGETKTLAQWAEELNFPYFTPNQKQVITF